MPHNGFLLFLAAVQRSLAQSLVRLSVGTIAVAAALVPLHKIDRPPDTLSTRTKKKSEVAQVQLMHI